MAAPSRKTAQLMAVKAATKPRERVPAGMGAGGGPWVFGVDVRVDQAVKGHGGRCRALTMQTTIQTEHGQAGDAAGGEHGAGEREGKRKDGVLPLDHLERGAGIVPGAGGGGHGSSVVRPGILTVYAAAGTVLRGVARPVFGAGGVAAVSWKYGGGAGAVLPCGGSGKCRGLGHDCGGGEPGVCKRGTTVLRDGDEVALLPPGERGQGCGLNWCGL